MYSFVVSDCCEIHPKSHSSEDDQSNVECDLEFVFVANISWERSKTSNGGQERDGDPDGHAVFSFKSVVVVEVFPVHVFWI